MGTESTYNEPKKKINSAKQEGLIVTNGFYGWIPLKDIVFVDDFGNEVSRGRRSGTNCVKLENRQAITALRNMFPKCTMQNFIPSSDVYLPGEFVTYSTMKRMREGEAAYKEKLMNEERAAAEQRQSESIRRDEQQRVLKEDVLYAREHIANREEQKGQRDLGTISNEVPSDSICHPVGMKNPSTFPSVDNGNLSPSHGTRQENTGAMGSYQQDNTATQQGNPQKPANHLNQCSTHGQQYGNPISPAGITITETQTKNLDGQGMHTNPALGDTSSGNGEISKNNSQAGCPQTETHVPSVMETRISDIEKYGSILLEAQGKTYEEGTDPSLFQSPLDGTKDLTGLYAGQERPEPDDILQEELEYVPEYCPEEFAKSAPEYGLYDQFLQDTMESGPDFGEERFMEGVKLYPDTAIKEDAEVFDDYNCMFLSENIEQGQCFERGDVSVSLPEDPFPCQPEQTETETEEWETSWDSGEGESIMEGIENRPQPYEGDNPDTDFFDCFEGEPDRTTQNMYGMEEDTLPWGSCRNDEGENPVSPDDIWWAEDPSGHRESE